MPTIIFLDLDMPVVSGREFLHGYKKIHPFISVVPSIYILSSFDQSKEFTSLIAEGVIQGYIRKPLTYDFFQGILLELKKRKGIG